MYEERVNCRVLLDGRDTGRGGSFVGSCIDARTSAIAEPGALYTVQRGATKIASYRMLDGVLRTWML